MLEFGVITCLGIASWVVSSCRLIDRLRAVVLFFVSVNQVLLRLWTRVIDIDPQIISRMGVCVLGWLRSRRSIDCSDWVRCSRLECANIQAEYRPLWSDSEWSETL